MDFISLISEHKDELSSLLGNKLKLNSDEIDTTLQSSGEVMQNVVSKTVESKGLDTLLNLFSSSENSTASSSLQKSIGNDLVKSLISKGLGKGKSSLIVQLILPILISKISGLIGGDKNNLTQLLGSSGNSKLGSIGGSLLKKLFN